MRKEKRYGVDLIDNKSYKYVLPMLGNDISDFINLIGCFIGDLDYPEYNNHIFLLFKHVENQSYMDFEKRLTKHPMYAYQYKYKLDEYMYIFNVPREHQIDYDSFKRSKYSQLSETYKRQMIKFHHFQKYGYGAPTIKILYRDPQLYEDKEEEINKGIPENDWTYIPRDQEIGEILHLEEEILNYNKFETPTKIHRETI